METPLDCPTHVGDAQLSRRALLHGAGAVLATAAIGGGAKAAASPAIPSWTTRLSEIAPGVLAYIQAGGPDIPYSGISNAGALVGPTGLTVIDSLPAPLQTKAFLASLAQAAPNKRIERLVYSHHHGDHIDGAVFFPPVEIVGTPFQRQAIAAMAPQPPWQARPGWAEGGESHARLAPITLVEGTLTYELGDMSAHMMSVRAHTAGDLLVHVPERKVLFAGDVGFFYVAPYAHWAYVQDWIALCEKILGMDDVELIVPGHGPLGGKRELADMRDYLVLFRKEARARYDAGMSPGQAAASITTLGRFDSWRGARDRLPMNMVRAFHDFAGDLAPQMDVAGTAAAIAEYAAITGYRPQN